MSGSTTGRAIVEMPSEWTREAFEAELARAGALPADQAGREALVAAARRNLALFETGERAPTPEQRAAIERARRRLDPDRSPA